MPAPLYTVATGFNLSAIMRRAHETRAAQRRIRRDGSCDSMGDALRLAWKAAKHERGEAEWIAERMARTPAQIEADTATLAREIAHLGADTFKRAA